MELSIYRSNLDGSDVELVKETSFTRSALFVIDFAIPTSNEKEQDFEFPQKVKLDRNYPNPFNPQTVIQYELPRVMNVNLTVFNFLGQKVKSLINQEVQSAGAHKVIFNAKRLASGIYFYQITTEESSITRKMMLIK